MPEQNNATPNPKMQEFFLTALQEIYWAETHLVDVLTTMGKAATDPELKEALIYTLNKRVSISKGLKKFLQ